MVVFVATGLFGVATDMFVVVVVAVATGCSLVAQCLVSIVVAIPAAMVPAVGLGSL